MRKVILSLRTAFSVLLFLAGPITPMANATNAKQPPAPAAPASTAPIPAPASTAPATPEKPARWKLESDGSLVWEVANNPADRAERGKKFNPSCASCHTETIELGGAQISAALTYGTYGLHDSSGLTLKRNVGDSDGTGASGGGTKKTATSSAKSASATPPTTSAKSPAPSATPPAREPQRVAFGKETTPRFSVDGTEVKHEDVRRFRRKDGVLTIESEIGPANEIALTRTIFVSGREPFYVERYVFENTSDAPVKFAATKAPPNPAAAPAAATNPANAAADPAAAATNPADIRAEFADIATRTLAPGETAESTLFIRRPERRL